MRVCLISEEFPPETGWGGIGTYAHVLATGLAELGHRVHVVARTWGEPGVTAVGGVRVHRLAIPEPSWRRGTYYFNLHFPETRELLLWTWQASRVVSRLAAAGGLDVIESPEFHAQGLAAGLRSRHIPLVVKLHTPAFLCRALNGVGAGGGPWDTAVSERLEHLLARRAWRLTSPSARLADDVTRRWRIRRSAVRVIPNPVDDELFAPSPGGEPAEPTLLYVGRLERRKGVETLVEMLPEVLRAFPGVRLRMVGKDHPSGPGGGSMVAHLGGRLRALRVPDGAVEFAGPVARTELPAVYRGAAVCLVPSNYENFPYTCLEAMACGRPVVGSAAGGIPEMITDGSDGLLVPPGRPAALAAAVVRLLADDRLRHRLGARARETVCARFGRRAVSAATAAFYRTLVRGKRGRGDGSG